MIDATSFQPDEIQLRNHIIFCQVYDSFIASDVKLALLEKLPYDYPIFIVYAAGSKQQRIEKVPLYERSGHNGEQFNERLRTKSRK